MLLVASLPDVSPLIPMSSASILSMRVLNSVLIPNVFYFQSLLLICASMRRSSSDSSSFLPKMKQAHPYTERTIVISPSYPLLFA